FADVDGLDLVGDARLLAHDGDLVAVGRGPVVKLDGRLGHGGCSLLRQTGRDAWCLSIRSGHSVWALGLGTRSGRTCWAPRSRRAHVMAGTKRGHDARHDAGP